MNAHDLEAVASQFGVDHDQVERDHLISFMLAAISEDIGTDDVVFFGGTALARTHLTDMRLSEDIDLLARGPRPGVAAALERAARRLRRSHGRITWIPPLTQTKGSQPAVMQIADGPRVQIQLLAAEGYPAWETEVRDIYQRYSDAPPARLRVYTATSFAAGKLATWMDRGAARDLFDMFAMAERGLITADAVSAFTKHGPFTSIPDWAFASAPDSRTWLRDLGHQMRLRVSATEALEAVRSAWEAAQR